MTIHYTMVFVLLIFEMSVFVILLLPMPSNIRRIITRWISTSSVVAQAQYVLKVLFVFVLILFLDSLNRAFRTEEDHEIANHLHSDTLFHMKVFRAQRNMYLTGFTVFLSLLLNRFISLITEMSKIEEQLSTLKKQASQNSNQAMKFIDGNEELEKKIKDLEDQLKTAKKESSKTEAVVTQAKNLSEEYNRLADKYNELEKKLDGPDSNKKDK